MDDDNTNAAPISKPRVRLGRRLIEAFRIGDRDKFNQVYSWIGGIAAITSLGLAMGAQLSGTDRWRVTGRVITGLWVFLPPVFFWMDWVLWSDDEQVKADTLKHTHDLARNVWLALVTVLVAMFGINPFK